MAYSLVVNPNASIRAKNSQGWSDWSPSVEAITYRKEDRDEHIKKEKAADAHRGRDKERPPEKVTA